MSGDEPNPAGEEAGLEDDLTGQETEFTGAQTEEEGTKPRLPPALSNSANMLTYKLMLLFRWVFDVILRGFNVILTLIVFVVKFLSGLIKVFVAFLPHILVRTIPEKRLSGTRQNLIYAGIDKDPEEVISILTVYSTMFGVIGFVGSLFLMHQPAVYAFVTSLLAFASIWMGYAMIINMLIYKRTESVETALPDLLEMIAQNMITGMTVYNSLWSAARPEFGPVADEIQSAARLTLTGVSLEEALFGITEHVKSDKLERSIKLIVGGMKSGGELPAVLQGVSQDMRAERNLKKQMAAETSAYAIFIMFTIFVGTPLLFSISHQFMTIFTNLIDETGLADIVSSGGEGLPGSGMMSISELPITPQFFMKYAVATVIALAFFGAFLIGLIKTGKPISGLTRVPTMVIVAVGILFLADYIIGNALSGMLRF